MTALLLRQPFVAYALLAALHWGAKLVVGFNCNPSRPLRASCGPILQSDALATVLLYALFFVDAQASATLCIVVLTTVIYGILRWSRPAAAPRLAILRHAAPLAAGVLSALVLSGWLLVHGERFGWSAFALLNLAEMLAVVVALPYGLFALLARMPGRCGRRRGG
ncbi:hypothetical protein NPA31_019300 [Aurantimonas sp. MSK8Z-1]|uniref:hypothetical protein n=1 Tax=Mangrovibrevibacter kandeliae TaxID=2968473 RepID=UPI002117ED5F|nr:hypothetical protein [Aurantimonas sp. MSK8Z-1]MCW4117110.1 hypothetical protein [Aurantimonas sp. MSK8Z-1]